MSNPTYRSPKQTYQEIVLALGRIRAALANTRPFKIGIQDFVSKP